MPAIHNYESESESESYYSNSSNTTTLIDGDSSEDDGHDEITLAEAQLIAEQMHVHNRLPFLQQPAALPFHLYRFWQITLREPRTCITTKRCETNRQP